MKHFLNTINTKILISSLVIAPTVFITNSVSAVIVGASASVTVLPPSPPFAYPLVPGGMAGFCPPVAPVCAFDEPQDVAFIPVPPDLSFAAPTAKVDSHFIHLDGALIGLPGIPPPGASPIIGSVTFDNPIIDIFFSDVANVFGPGPTLDFSDPVYGSPLSAYPTGAPFRGLEFAGLLPLGAVFPGAGVAGDFLAVSADLKTLSFQLDPFSAGDRGFLDQIRVVTANPVPEPLTILGSITAVAFGSIFRRKVSKCN